MVSESVQLSHYTNAEAKNSFHEGKDQPSHKEFTGKQGHIGSVGASTCQDAEHSGKVLKMIDRDTEGDLKEKTKHNEDMTLQDLYNDEVGFNDEDDEDSDWEPVQEPSKDREFVKATTYLDVQNSGKVLEMCTTSDCDVNLQQEKKVDQHKDMSLQDMYNNEVFDDDNDCDWDPFQEPITTFKWFCVNCTMVNYEDIVHCDICGEHRESEILTHGCFASPFLKGHPGSELEAIGTLKGGCM